MPRSKPKPESFEHFYLTKVALGECCGCAEQAIRLREMEGSAGARSRPPETRRTIRPLRVFFATLVASFGAGRRGALDADR
jgi:hypothetical protein